MFYILYNVKRDFITTKEIIDDLELPRPTVAKATANLEKYNLINKVGMGRGTYFYIKNSFIRTLVLVNQRIIVPYKKVVVIDSASINPDLTYLKAGENALCEYSMLVTYKNEYAIYQEAYKGTDKAPNVEGYSNGNEIELQLWRYNPLKLARIVEEKDLRGNKGAVDPLSLYASFAASREHWDERVSLELEDMLDNLKEWLVK